MTILENNCMQSTASSAGYSTGGTLISAFAAYIMLNDQSLPLPLMLAWVFFLAVLGVTMAIPMKRQMINIEQLRFPSGIAAAETLRALHSHGEKGMRAAKALGIAGVLAAVSQFWTDGLKLISRAAGAVLDRRPGRPASTKRSSARPGSDRTVMFAWDPIFLAAGALTGLRVSASMMLGGDALLGRLRARSCSTRASSPASGFRDIVQWTLWGGVGLHGHLRPALLRPAVAERAARLPQSGRACSRARRPRPASEMDAIETPDLLVPRRAARLAGRPGLAGPRHASTCPIGRARWPCSSPSSWPWWPAA